MARARGRKSVRFQRRRRGNRWSGNRVSETSIFTLTPGKDGFISAKQLSNVPQHSVWRPLHAKLSVSQDNAGGSNPAMQLIWMDPNGIEVASSQLRLMSGNSHTVSLAYPRNAGWYSPLDVVQPAKILVMRAVCTKSSSSEPTYGCILNMTVAVRPEIVSGQCPKRVNVYEHHSDPPVDEFEMLGH